MTINNFKLAIPYSCEEQAISQRKLQGRTLIRDFLYPSIMPMKRIDFTKRNKLVMPNPKGKREKIMTEIKTNETINVFPCTYILISRAIRPLDHETITKICQQDEDFQKRVLDFLINICGSSVYTDIEFQDCQNMNLINPLMVVVIDSVNITTTIKIQICGHYNTKHPQIWSIVLYVDTLEIMKNMMTIHSSVILVVVQK